MFPHEATAGSRAAGIAAATIGAVAALALAVALPSDGVTVSLANFWWISVAAVAVTGWAVMRMGVWSAAGAYAAVFWCFHFGLVAVVAVRLVAPSDLSLWDQLWLFGPYGADAALVALVGGIGFVSGAQFVHACRRTRPTQGAPDTPFAHPHGVAGSVLVVTSILVWYAIVLSTNGTKGLFGSYSEYLQATAEFSGLMSGLWLALGCGIVMSVTGSTGWLRTATIGLFVCFAVVALPLGLRGEIMFPSIAALVAAARCGRTLRPARAAAFLLGLIFLIPVVKEVRQTGLQGVPNLVLEMRLFDAFVEMGGSLHPVEKVVRWRAEGEPLDLGASYWAPIERAAARVLPGLTSPAAEDDMRIMNVLVTDRVGAIGFSPVAEAYRNFGAVGVALILGLLGAGLAAIDAVRDRQAAVLSIAAIYVPLLTNVRNSFISVPAQCVVGILVVVLLGALRHMRQSVFCRSYAGSSYIGR